MALVTLTKAKENVLLAAMTDDQIQDYIDAASSVIERYLDTKIEEATVTDILDGNDLSYIYVNNNYVTALTSAYIVESDSTETEIDVDNLDFNDSQDRCRVFYSVGNESEYSIFPKGKNNIKITYTYGYSEIPAELQTACMQVAVSMLYAENQKQNPAYDSERLGEYNYKLAANSGTGSTNTAIPNTALNILDSYRRVVF